MRSGQRGGRWDGLSLRGTLLLGLILVPVVCGVTFFGLVFSTQAMFGAPRADLDKALTSLLVQGGWLPTESTGPTSTPSAQEPASVLPSSSTAVTDPTSTQNEPGANSESAAAPSPSSTATTTPTVTASPSPTATSTPTWTPTPTNSPTTTPSPRPTHTPTWSPTSTATSAPPTVTSAPTRTPTAGLSPTATDTQCSVTLNTDFETKVVELVNQERQNQSLPAYEVDSRLRAAARVHATDMACNGFTGHTGSDGSSVGDRVLDQGYVWSWVGENYYVTSNTTDGPQIAFEWWMDSTPHRSNLLSPNYTQFGVGYVYGENSDYGGYFVVVFARPE